MYALVMLLSLLLSLLLPLLASATTYYVATTGSDSANGTAVGTPYRSIQKCASVMVAGDTCTVADGTYTSTDGGALQTTGIVAYIKNTYANGTAGNPITIRSTNAGGAAITIPGASASSTSAFNIGRNYWVFEGFDISGGTGTFTTGGATAFLLNAGSNTGTTIRHNTIHGVGRANCTNSANAFSGMSGGGTDLLIEENLIYGGGRLRNGESGCTTDKYQHDHGIYLTTAPNARILHNIIYDWNRGFPIQLYAGTIVGGLIAHNTIAGKSPTGSPAGQVMLAMTGATSTLTIKNNIFYDPPTAPFTTFSLSCSSIDYDYNLTDNADANMFVTAQPACATDGGNNFKSQTAANIFTNAAANDYTLQASSPAIDAGLSTVCTTYNGASCDIGAFEVPVCGTAEVGTVDATSLIITCTNNAFPPLLPASSMATFTVTENGAPITVSSCARVGDNTIDCTLAASIVSGRTVLLSYNSATGNVTDSALIGNTTNQPLLSFTDLAVTNNVGGAAPSHVFTQQSYKFFGLRGTEAAPVATPYATAPENTNILVRSGGSVRLRLAITCTDADCPPTGFYPYYSRNGGAYAVVPDVFGWDNYTHTTHSYLWRADGSSATQGSGSIDTWPDHYATGTAACTMSQVTDYSTLPAMTPLGASTTLHYIKAICTGGASGGTFDIYQTIPTIDLTTVTGNFGYFWYQSDGGVAGITNLDSYLALDATYAKRFLFTWNDSTAGHRRMDGWNLAQWQAGDETAAVGGYAWTENATKARHSLTIAADASVTVYFSDWIYNYAVRPQITIWAADNDVSTYPVIYQQMAARSLVGSYAPTALELDAGGLTTAQLLTMQGAGWSIHGHQSTSVIGNYTALSAEDLETEIDLVTSTLLSAGFRLGAVWDYPGSNGNTTTNAAIVSNGYGPYVIGGNTGDDPNGLPLYGGLYSPWLWSIAGETRTEAQIKTAIDHAVLYGEALSILFHKIDGTTTCSATCFANVLDYLAGLKAASTLDVVTWEHLLSRRYGVIALAGTSPDADIPTSGTATTDQLSTSGTFAAGALVRTSNAIPTVDMVQNGKTELEYVLKLATTGSAGETIDIRAFQQDGTAMNAVTVTPRITIQAPASGMGF